MVSSLLPSLTPHKFPIGHKKRVVEKNGGVNVSYKHISKKWRHFFSDGYTTLQDVSWTFCFGIFAASFYTTWVAFGLGYFLILYLHGDLDPSSSSTPCILEVRDFSSCFLFSLETQHTIGYGNRLSSPSSLFSSHPPFSRYGTRQPTTECPHAVLVVSLQAVLGCLIQAFMVGLVFSKLSRCQLLILHYNFLLLLQLLL